MNVVQRMVAPGLAHDEKLPSQLDWQAFSAAYFPGTRRHNLEAIVAYGAYKRLPAAGTQAGEAHVQADAISNEALVERWEDEGGASLRLRRRKTQHSR